MDARIKSAHDVENGARAFASLIQLSNSGRDSSPVFFDRRRGRRIANSNSRLPRGERSAGRRGGVRDPRWMAGETIRWDALRRRPLAPLGTRRLPALHSGVLRLTGRAFENVDQPRLSASSWRRVLLPGSGAPPSPECFRVRFPETRGAASVDGGVSPLGRPGEVEGTSPAFSSPLLRLHGVP